MVNFPGTFLKSAANGNAGTGRAFQNFHVRFARKLMTKKSILIGDDHSEQLD